MVGSGLACVLDQCVEIRRDLQSRMIVRCWAGGAVMAEERRKTI